MVDDEQIARPVHGPTPEPVVDKSIIIDCQGKTIVPGFIDAYFHLFSFVNSLASLDLSPRNDVHSIEKLKIEIEAVAQKLPRGRWIRARGYDEFYFAENRHPTKTDLDQAAPHHQIRITHRSGHADVLNSLALQQVGISRETGDPVDGRSFRIPILCDLQILTRPNCSLIPVKNSLRRASRFTSCFLTDSKSIDAHVA